MLSNWIPYKLEIVDQEVRVLWLDLEDRFIAEPFFDETILENRICAKNKGRGRLVSQSDIRSLCEWVSQVETCPVTAFIFHVSRCGSTLLSQCLVADKKYVVIPEAPLLDEILQLEEALLPEEISRERFFKAILTFLGQRRLGQEQLFIKLDSWHIHQYNLLRGWFLNTPFYFLSREPKAIIQSHEKRRGIQMIPGYLSEGANPVQVHAGHYADFSLFTADVLSNFYKGLIDVRAQRNPLDGFYDYASGMLGLLADFDAHVGTQLSASGAAVDRLNKHSKYPDQVFKERQEDAESILYEHSHTSYSQYYKLLCRSEKV
ncbi:hypothetical protein [Sphingobacterium yanglingense]|uniref:Sulfotransferase family protein n=1 Tax=Sphingobacterium yanglingense TaxID=1437280 RepID=A0A4R6W4S8_9SPHI|nr:hypothetical protein [Sphingobacterium yanglingense]TDQ73707.1 hypothetical protein CLV99_4144 [Sphingobacterium yanglingense]